MSFVGTLTQVLTLFVLLFFSSLVIIPNDASSQVYVLAKAMLRLEYVTFVVPPTFLLMLWHILQLGCYTVVRFFYIITKSIVIPFIYFHFFQLSMV